MCPVKGGEASSYDTFGPKGEGGDGQDAAEKAHQVACGARADDKGARDSQACSRKQEAGASDGSGEDGGGLCGPGGLLSVPHVPSIIAMICLLSVRRHGPQEPKQGWLRWSSDVDAIASWLVAVMMVLNRHMGWSLKPVSILMSEACLGLLSDRAGRSLRFVALCPLLG